MKDSQVNPNSSCHCFSFCLYGSYVPVGAMQTTDNQTKICREDEKLVLRFVYFLQCNNANVIFQKHLNPCNSSCQSLRIKVV